MMTKSCESNPGSMMGYQPPYNRYRQKSQYQETNCKSQNAQIYSTENHVWYNKNWNWEEIVIQLDWQNHSDSFDKHKIL